VAGHSTPSSIRLILNQLKIEGHTLLNCISGTFLNYIKPIRKNAGYNDGAKYKEYGLFGSEFPLPW